MGSRESHLEDGAAPHGPLADSPTRPRPVTHRTEMPLHPYTRTTATRTRIDVRADDVCAMGGSATGEGAGATRMQSGRDGLRTKTKDGGSDIHGST